MEAKSEMQPAASESHEGTLTHVLRAAAADDHTRGASAAVEARLLAEVRSLGRARRRRSMLRVVVAGAVLVGLAIPAWRLAVQPDRVSRGGPSGPRGAVPAEVTTDFFPLKYVNVPVTDGQIVRLEVPRAALEPFGLESVDGVNEDGDTVLADVVVGVDGLA